MTAPILYAVGEFTSYIRTGGMWVYGDTPEDHSCWDRKTSCGLYWHGYYYGGTREPGRFTAKLAPVTSDPLAKALARDCEAVTVPPAPRYDTPAQITTMAGGMPAKGEELGVKFVRALRALGPGWERPMLTNVETPWGEKPWRVPDVPGVRKNGKVRRRRQRVAA